MSVPGAIAPAEFGGMTLVDGTLTSNLPAEAARAIGADTSARNWTGSLP
jgi:NTE family protein